MGGVLGAVFSGRPQSAGPAVRVTAEGTIFYAPPDGRANLVRFRVTGVEAPAARLRVYDAGNRLLGTAGLLRTSAGELYGELWLRLVGRSPVVSELEAPGLRGVHRTAHTVSPGPRWTVYWIPVADAESLLRRLDQEPPLVRLTAAALYRRASLLAVPDVATWTPSVDHLDALEPGRALAELAARYGISAGRLAVTPDSDVPTAPLVRVLVGAGMRVVAVPRGGARQIEWWEAGGNARILAVPVETGGSAAPNLLEPPGAFQHRIESWLAAQPPGLLRSAERGQPPEGLAFTVDRDTVDRPLDALQALAAWRRRFAYPRILAATGGDVERLVAHLARVAPGARPAGPDTRLTPPTPAELLRVAEQREVRRRAGAVVWTGALTGVAAPTEAPLEALAAGVRSGFPGFVVYNPAPYLRTDVVAVEGAHPRVVTDIPPLGYAAIVDIGDGRAEPGATPHDESGAGGVLQLDTAQVRMALDGGSGAVASLISAAEEIQWVRPDSDGLNAIPGAILERVQTQLLPGVGQRVIAWRWARASGVVRTVVTLYDALPWVDIENEAMEAGDAVVEYLFPFALLGPEVRWDDATGVNSAPIPIERAAHLRWVALADRERSVFFRALDAPYFSVDPTGTLVSVAHRGRSRYRIAGAGRPATMSDAARFGWSAEPLLVARHGANPHGPLPRFGSFLHVAEPGAAIVGVQRAPGGAVVLVQELLGESRVVTLVPGLLGFADARRVDYAGRHVADRDVRTVAGRAEIPVGAFEIAAVELSRLAPYEVADQSRGEPFPSRCGER